MHALNKKLLRDLRRLWGQVLGVALVVASGVAVLVMSLTTLEALQETTTAYYERYRFAHVFASAKRAPEQLADRIAEIPGVLSVETRVDKLATLDIEGFEEPVIGQMVSIPEQTGPKHNGLALRAGRMVAPGRPNEVVLSEAFAEAHTFRVDEHLQAIINGKKRTLRVVGIALSPEFVYAIAPGGLMPDDLHYGVLWMGRDALAAAYDLDGAFSNVTLLVSRGAFVEAVIVDLDRLLDRYGGVGAIARKDQISNWFLMNEIEQLRAVASLLPMIFLAVAAFLSNMVLARLIAIERSEIGLIKAYGYSNREVAWHYSKMVIAMTAVGILLGWVVGAWLGRVNTESYAQLFHFPFLYFQPGPASFIVGALVSMLATVLGALSAVRRAAILPPAEAMRPPAPPVYQRAGKNTAGFVHWLDQPSRIILRNIYRWPFRSAMTSLGVALAIGVLIMALQWIDSINHIVQVYFFAAQRQDMTVGLVETQSSATLHEFKHMPGVLAAEPMRIVTANFEVGTHSHRGTLTGIPTNAHLQPIYDAKGYVVPVPATGLVLGSKLAEKLSVSVGDRVAVKILEGRRPTNDLLVVGVFETYIGVPAYMDLNALNRLLRERPSLEYINLVVDHTLQSKLFAKLQELPEISAVMLKRSAIDTFYETLAETLMMYVTYFASFAATLGFGVVYNSARISLSERDRELATLRILGFTRAEISYILLGEIGLLVLIALPLGCLAGIGLSWLMSASFETELYRVPPIIEHSTFGYAVASALGIAMVSALLVRRSLDRLDLIAVLKMRE